MMKGCKWLGPKRALASEDVGAQRIIQRRAQEIERIRMTRNRLLDSKRGICAAKGLSSENFLAAQYLHPLEALHGLGSTSRQHRLSCLQQLRRFYSGESLASASLSVGEQFEQSILACFADSQRGEEERVEVTCLIACIASSKHANRQEGQEAALLQSALPHLAATLSSSNSLQLEYTAWCLGSIACLSEQHRAVVWSSCETAGRVSHLLLLLTHKVRSTAKTAAWAVAQLIGQDAETAEAVLEHGCGRYCAKWIVKQCELLLPSTMMGMGRGHIEDVPQRQAAAAPRQAPVPASAGLNLLTKSAALASHVARSGQAVVIWPICSSGAAHGASGNASTSPAAPTTMSQLLARLDARPSSTAADGSSTAASSVQSLATEEAIEAAPVLPVPVLDLELVADMVALLSLLLQVTAQKGQGEGKTLLQTTLEVPVKGCKHSVLECAHALSSLTESSLTASNEARLAVAVPGKAGTVAIQSLTIDQLMELAHPCIETSVSLLSVLASDGMLTMQAETSASSASIDEDSMDAHAACSTGLAVQSPIPWAAARSSGHWLPSFALSPLEGLTGSTMAARPSAWSSAPTPEDKSQWTQHGAGTPMPAALSFQADAVRSPATAQPAALPFHALGLAGVCPGRQGTTHEMHAMEEDEL